MIHRVWGAIAVWAVGLLVQIAESLWTLHHWDAATAVIRRKHLPDADLGEAVAQLDTRVSVFVLAVSVVGLAVLTGFVQLGRSLVAAWLTTVYALPFITVGGWREYWAITRDAATDNDFAPTADPGMPWGLHLGGPMLVLGALATAVLLVIWARHSDHRSRMGAHT
ncbi:hypothetical protein V5P93_000110 [Actinokineospora auranticolor]|uniref:Uncharacterized protein n=1 Tax=Actinokineospora auranticolor TaxID=155976 RepID=A0A2S6GCD4_9PSEU|nr:hypothetical protein [Actinokineospora auranticolor]PPK61728.1 hypothetical protein CLV40_13925 [Actinokineospora auranticolor]